ncbi:hypothetical protein [Mucilaginibacter gilvus]|uniref:Uncharacterized protein n=1 Tax=Mucilaginibacter gilvus TaxID=2305909 RepID=A0A3S3VR92_9SPHI|nr:hypothetical protein [Mucilaginibacter gilvus]RWY54064.1 hypothetical protein EPL05_08440 [Mucilaginibacter gilvus]
MKKIIYTLVLISAAHVADAQGGLLNRLKNKINSGAKTTVSNDVASVAAPTSGIKYTDPSQFGKVIYTFSKAEMNAHGGSDGYGYNMWFPTIAVVNNQLNAIIADNNETSWSYNNGGLQKTGGKPNTRDQNKINNGSEFYGWSVDFTEHDQAASLQKKGPHVASGMIPGKAEQTYTFNGKVFSSFYIGSIAHNADSTVVAVAGASLTGGMKYFLRSSTGQSASLPAKFGARPLLSPNGKVSAALMLSTNGNSYDVVTTMGANISIGNFINGLGWLRDSGSIFNVESNDPKALDRNGKLYKTFNVDVDPKMLFISADDNTLCWGGYRGLYFSDGTIFENGQSPRKVVLDGKEVIIFLDVELASGKLYLCRHDL